MSMSLTVYSYYVVLHESYALTSELPRTDSSYRALRIVLAACLSHSHMIVRCAV